MSYKNSRNSSFKMKKGLDVDPDAGNRSCVYCHNDNGSFFDKNGDIKYGRHHVKNCCKGYYRRQEKKEWEASKPPKKSKDGWQTIQKKKNYKKEQTIVKELKKQNVFKILEEDDIGKKKKEVTRFEKAEKKGMIPKFVAPKEVKSNWLNVLKAPKKVKQTKQVKEVKKVKKVKFDVEDIIKPKPKTEPIKVSNKSLPIPTFLKPFNKKKVISFEEAKAQFSNTDSWGSDDDDDF